MDACLLCLDVANDVDNVIRVNSTQWETENMKDVIEKHLWSVDTLKTYNWMCNSCWQDLDDFHKFYMRIEKTHLELNKDMLDVKASEANDELFLNLNTMCKAELMENSIQTEFLMEQPDYDTESENPLIKVELEEDKIKADEMPLKQRRRRGRPPKSMVSNVIPIKKDLKKLEKNKEINKNQKHKDISSNEQIEPKEKSLVKSEIESLETISKENNILSDANENDDDDDSDTEYEEPDDDKQQVETCSRKKRKNPDEKTRKEHDKLIAEYFKIFCSLCQMPIENFIALRKHFREEHDKRGFVICCKKKIFTRPILVDHIHFHLDPNYFKCKQCDKIYSDRCTLESHAKIHEDGRQQDRNHTCDICGKSFVGSTQLENHKQTHAPDYEKKFSCSDCGKFFTTLYSLNYHIQAIHHNKYVKICDICGKTMRCRNSFKLHMEKHDNKLATPINCDICGLRLIDRRGLRRHKNSQHPVGGKKEYSCHICSKISPNLRALRTHVRFAHETGYIHKCTMCDKAFKRPEALKEHMATHTGTPLYTCPWCPKTFISNGNMHNHRKKSHPKEWEEAQRQKYGGIFPSNYKAPISLNTTNTTINNTM